MPKLQVLYALFAAALTSTSALACSSCGCDLASDWVSRDLAVDPGTTLTLRYNYVPQTQLRAGTDQVDHTAILLPTTREIEQHTFNHYALLGLDHMFNGHWAVNVQLPYSAHPHATVAAGDTNVSTSDTQGLGDLRVVARYQQQGAAGVTGVQFGLKLPTGGFHQTFQSGPAAGQPVDRGLQAGTGTAHLLVGGYRFGKLNGSFDYLMQVQAELPLTNREAYRPGISGIASLGVSYSKWHAIKARLELNLRAAGKDHGANADPDNSGGVQLSVSPGFTVPLGRRISAFGTLQLPLYEQVNGFQLAPRATLSGGVSWRL